MGLADSSDELILDGSDESDLDVPPDGFDVAGNAGGELLNMDSNLIERCEDVLPTASEGAEIDPDPFESELMGGMRSDDAFSEPDFIGDYEVLSTLGSGGMGEVYKAKDRRTGKVVAIKSLLRKSDPEGLERFRREAEIGLRLSHPKIVEYFDFVEAGKDSPFLVMDFIDGVSVESVLKGGPMSAKVAAWFVEQICEAVSYAHGQGVVHRDIKPDNILFRRSRAMKDGKRPFEIVLLDFGVAHNVKASSGPTLTGAQLGTLPYMSPEQANDSKHVDQRSDIYGIGAVLFEFVTGRRPFVATSADALVKKIFFDPPPRPSQVCREVPVALDAIVIKCLAKKPEERYQSADELARELRAFCLGRPVGANATRSEGDGVSPVAVKVVWALITGLVAVAWLSSSGGEGAAGDLEIEILRALQDFRSPRPERYMRLREDVSEEDHLCRSLLEDKKKSFARLKRTCRRAGESLIADWCAVVAGGLYGVCPEETALASEGSGAMALALRRAIIAAKAQIAVRSWLEGGEWPGVSAVPSVATRGGSTAAGMMALLLQKRWQEVRQLALVNTSSLEEQETLLGLCDLGEALAIEIGEPGMPIQHAIRERQRYRLLESAQRHFNSALNEAPRYTIALLGRARCQLSRHRAGSAIRDLERSILLSRRSALLEESLAEAYLMAGELPKAMKVISGLLDRQGRSARLEKLRGRALLALGEKEAALDVIEFSVSRNPRDPQIHILHGRVLESLGQTVKALSAYSQALAIRPHDEVAAKATARLLALQEKTAKSSSE